MRKILRYFYLVMCWWGVDPVKIARNFFNVPFAYRDYLKFRSMSLLAGITSQINFTPSLNDKGKDAGVAKGIYFHQDLHIARKIYENDPRRHIDVGSRVDGLISHIAVFRAVEVIDIRPLRSKEKNIAFLQADMSAELDSVYVNACDSLSSTFAIGHFGLGRYGDRLDPEGHIKGLENFKKMLEVGGLLYLSVPIGPQVIEFNSHRIFSMTWLLDVLLCDFELIEFSYVDDDGDLHENVKLQSLAIESNCGCKFGAAMFILKKK